MSTTPEMPLAEQQEMVERIGHLVSIYHDTLTRGRVSETIIFNLVTDLHDRLMSGKAYYERDTPSSDDTADTPD